MESNSELLKGKVALITGCNRGIGKAVSDVFVENGAFVYAVARKPDSLKFYESHPNVHPVYLDITDRPAVRELFLLIKKQSGRLDILVNNAGVMRDAVLGMITDDDMEYSFRTNVFAGILMMQYAAKSMLRQKSGSIINLASIMGRCGNAGQIVYSASKGAVIAMTKSAAKELAPSCIRVNAIAPGIIETDMFMGVPEEKREALRKRVGMGHMGSPEDVANAALFLASDLSLYVSGQILGVDGMMSY